MRRNVSTRVARMVGTISLGLLLTGAAVAPAQAARAAGPKALACGQAAQAGRPFNSYNQCATRNGAKPALVVLAKPALINQIAGYHTSTTESRSSPGRSA